MATRGTSIVVEYVAWDTASNVGKTGDVANHTLRWVKDGTSSAPANSPSEVDSTNAPGIYKITLSSSECTCDSGILAGKSSTASVVIIPRAVTFEKPEDAWDGLLASHTVAASFGLAGQIIRSGTAQGGGADYIRLDASASTTTDFYKSAIVQIVSGTGSGQTRYITDYNNSVTNWRAYVYPDWATQPDSSSVFVVRPHGDPADAVWNYPSPYNTYSMVANLGQRTIFVGSTDTIAANTVVFSSGASSSDDVYNGCIVYIFTNSTLRYQPYIITDYVGSTKTATLDRDVVGTIVGSCTIFVETAPDYALYASLPSNFADLSINGSGQVSFSNTVSVKKNTALANFKFLMVDSTDHITAKTGLTVTAERSLDGAAFASCSNSVIEISDGWYRINLSSSDLNADTVALKFTASGADTTNILITTNAA